MEQTLVNQFFPAVKNSFSNHPAKRRKVSDSPNINMEEIVVGKQRGGRMKSVKTSSRASRTKKAVDVSLSLLLTAKPVALSSEPTSVTDQHSELKRKIPQKRSKKSSNTCPTLPPTAEKTETPNPTNTIAQEASSSRGNLKVDPWISEQAKLILQHGRGTAALQASKNNGSAPAKSLKPSDLLNPDTEDASANKGNVREDCAKKFQEKSKQESKAGRGRSRQKYAHLLNPEKTSSSSTPNASDKSAETMQSSSKRIPAHQRFKHLVAEKPSTAFTLPQKYKDLLEMFRCLDSVLFLLHRRKATCTFERLKKSVQTMLGKKFSEKNLAQMKTVYPKGLIFRQEKNLRDLNGMPTGQQLTIDANFEEVSNPKSAKEEISQNVLITRRNIFESSLVEITKKFHQKFLRKLNLKIADSDLHRWHPNFKLDDVPDIPEATMPQATVIKTCTSVKDMLEKTTYIPQVERALQKVAETKEVENNKSSDIKTTRTDTKPTNTKGSGSNKILKGVSDALLERIKEKEMKNAELAMLRNPEQEKRLEMMDRLPDFVRILKTYFTTERKAAIAMEDCVQKLSESFGTITSTAKIEEHVRLLNELVPNWLLIVNVRKCPYLKLAKNSDVNVVFAKLASIKAKESKR